MSIITYAIRVARKYYDESTYYHVMRVAGYVANDNLIKEDKMVMKLTFQDYMQSIYSI